MSQKRLENALHEINNFASSLDNKRTSVSNKKKLTDNKSDYKNTILNTNISGFIPNTLNF